MTTLVVFFYSYFNKIIYVYQNADKVEKGIQKFTDSVKIKRPTDYKKYFVITND